MTEDYKLRLEVWRESGDEGAITACSKTMASEDSPLTLMKVLGTAACAGKACSYIRIRMQVEVRRATRSRHRDEDRAEAQQAVKREERLSQHCSHTMLPGRACWLSYFKFQSTLVRKRVIKLLSSLGHRVALK